MAHDKAKQSIVLSENILSLKWSQVRIVKTNIPLVKPKNLHVHKASEEL